MDCVLRQRLSDCTALRSRGSLPRAAYEICNDLGDIYCARRYPARSRGNHPCKGLLPMKMSQMCDSSFTTHGHASMYEACSHAMLIRIFTTWKIQSINGNFA